MITEIDASLLEKIADLTGKPVGAFNIRKDSGCEARQSTEHIAIDPQPEGKSGIIIRIKDGTKGEQCHIPVIISKTGLSEMVYNDFYIGEDCDVDIVVLRKQTLMEEPIVKRIIATEGQTVDIDFDDGVVYVDGKALDEPYVNEPVHDRENFEGKITVPEGCVFVMGDNRNASTDSRDARLGCVDERYIMGRVYFTLFPVKNIGVVK